MSAMSRDFRSLCRLVLTAILVLIATAAAYQQLGRPCIGVDDANITLVYARNLSRGHGFVYTPGGERVEGCTSMLYALIASVFFLFTDKPELLLLAFNVVLLIGTVWLAQACGRLLSVRNFSKWIAPSDLLILAWLLASPAFVIWTTLTLMDTGLWCFLLTVSAYVCLAEANVGRALPADNEDGGQCPPYMQRRIGAVPISLLVSALILCRPEGFIFAPIVLLLVMHARKGQDRGRTSALRRTITPWLAFGISAIGLTLFRVLYFGYPLPNTYYAKVEPDKILSAIHGLKYLMHFLAAYKIAGVVCAVGVLAWVARAAGFSLSPGTRDASFSFAVALMITGLLLPIPGGGDHFAAFRFYQPAWPLLILPALYLLHWIAKFTSRFPEATNPHRPNILHAGTSSAPPWIRSALEESGAAQSLPRREGVSQVDTWRRAQQRLWLVTIIIVPLFFITDPISWPHIAAATDLSLDREFQIARTGRRTGMALSTMFPDHPPTVGVITAGGIALTYRGPCIDLLGLNNVLMGHSPGDRQGPKNHAAFDPATFWLLRPNIVHPVFMTHASDAQACREVEALATSYLKNIPQDREFRARYVLAVVRPAKGPLVSDLHFYVPRGMPPDGGEARVSDEQLLVAYFDGATLERVRTGEFKVRVYQTIRK